MPMDAVCLRAMTSELSAAIVGARIEKIQQPARDSVVLLLPRSARLLLNAGANQPRIQLTRMLRENPAQPPMFCMLLRKHLSGGKILSVTQPGLERVVEIAIDVADEMGERSTRKLVLEAMGRHSNLILVDNENRIIDCLRRVDMEMSEKRQVMPGMFYHLPPAQEDKKNPLETGEFLSLLSNANRETTADKFLLDSFYGLSPLICREISFGAFGSTDKRLLDIDDAGARSFASAFLRFTENVTAEHFKPEMLIKNGKPSDFSFMPIAQYEGALEKQKFENFSEMLDVFYETRDKAERMRALGQDLQKTATNARDRIRRKLLAQEKEYAETQNRDRLRKCGDLITANLYRMERGARKLVAQDYYDENCPDVEIQLDPLLTPQQNAAKYYKNYNKAKTAEKMLSEQMEKGREELFYLESIVEEICEAESESDFREIRAELRDAGYISQHSGEKKQAKKAFKPREFVSSAGLFISVGRNNKQNDQLTTKEAFKTDIWFHTQKIHGAHVILHTAGTEPDARSLTEAATIAAYYSKAREGQNVPVDYTPVRFVKKPAGAKPGMVIYETYQTGYVTPDAELVKRLAK